MITSIYVLFDVESVGRVIDIPGHEAIEIERTDCPYLYLGRKIVRRAFPIMLCWACTVHKVQGMSFDKIVIDIVCSVFESGMAYVALSRVRSLDGLYITNLNLKGIVANSETVKEDDRLTKIENQAE